VLDRAWLVKVWDLWGETGFAQIEPVMPPSLEILVERGHDSAACDQLHLKMSRAYFNYSFAVGERRSLWHFCLWNSIRHYRCRENVAHYFNELQTHDRFNELAYHEALERRTPSPDVKMALPSALLER
jgi:hypothetical protein